MSCLLAAFAYNIDNVSLLFVVLSWHSVSIVSSFSCFSACNVSKPYTCCSVILQYISSNHLPCRLWYIVFQILQVQVECHTVFIESFCILMYYVSLTDVWLMISCKWWYDVILIIPWIIQKQLCMVIFLWFCMNFVPSCT